MHDVPLPGLFDLEDPRPTAAEFFAGIGLVRIGLERAGFRVTWSNDIDPDKHDMYTKHFGESDVAGHKFVPGDIAEVQAEDLPDVDLAWASFPCTDLSVAGNRDGLDGKHSGTFWRFMDIMKAKGDRKPAMVAIENVSGFATSRSGADLQAAIKALNALDYSVDVLVIDALRFVPQSRPRMFLIGVQNPDTDTPVEPHPLRPTWLDALYQTDLRMHKAVLPTPPEMRTTGLKTIVEHFPDDHPRWWDEKRTADFVNSLSDKQAARLSDLKALRRVVLRTAYRRTRDGIPRWEIRNDEVAGCLRTARGGSSKQALVRIAKGKVRVRWMTSREYASLMGAEEYKLDGLRDNQALFGFGDAVVVDVVEWLGNHYLMPLIKRHERETAPAERDESARITTHVRRVDRP
ncbi:MAG: DNA (cytosine-5-)-methyltransferase [Saccharothrix sp.]|nr:DNA (cytosine-5-)-methyltransferase [Saccharothrix sp.]